MRLLQDVREPWKHFTICTLLNRTTGAQVAPVLRALWRYCPNARSLAEADVGRLEGIIRPVGLFRVKAARLKKIGAYFCALRRGWRPSRDGWPPGTGDYAKESYRILFEGHRPAEPKDSKLREYVANLKRGGLVFEPAAPPSPSPVRRV